MNAFHDINKKTFRSTFAKSVVHIYMHYQIMIISLITEAIPHLMLPWQQRP